MTTKTRAENELELCLTGRSFFASFPAAIGVSRRFKSVSRWWDHFNLQLPLALWSCIALHGRNWVLVSRQRKTVSPPLVLRRTVLSMSCGVTLAVLTGHALPALRSFSTFVAISVPKA